MRFLIPLFGCLLIAGCTQKKQSSFSLPSLFSDHIVLQQKEDVTFWGDANPDSEVSIQGSWGGVAKAKAGKDGKWTAVLKTPQAGGPYKVEISDSDTTVTLEDVMIGEVWLASGQSNMGMPLKGWPPNDPILNSEEEIANASYPQIRMFTVIKALSDTIEKDVAGSWKVCNPDNAGDFSATAFFFAKSIHAELGVPVGIIHSSWGGTPAESWVSKKGLEEMDDFKEVLAKIHRASGEMKKVNEWMKQLPVIDLSVISDDTWEKIDLKDSRVPEENFPDENWNVMQLPVMWELTSFGEFDGVIWFRKTVEIYDENQNYKISLGPIDDMDMTYINGKLIGSTVKDGFWNVDRLYEIPSGILKKGKNLISVKVIDTRGGGGIWGDKEKMYLENSQGKRTDISGEWKYLPVGEYRNGNLFVFGAEGGKYLEKPACSLHLTPYTPTTLYNAMIAPLTSYKIKGVIWYQGESNVGRAQQYERLFPLLISDWRKQWNSEFPFYYVQIAPYAYQNTQKEKSQELRDAQRKTLKLSNTGMVVTMDIGNNTNIHPGNKQDVGKRLAMIALAKTYGKQLVHSGPVYDSHSIDGNKIIVSFLYVDNGLKQSGKNLDGFEIAGFDKVFYPAKAMIKDKNVIVWSDKVKIPLSVRYAWRDTAAATLFNTDGLPASSFEATGE
jgi:sialate O-acetylesterase